MNNEEWKEYNARLKAEKKQERKKKLEDEKSKLSKMETLRDKMDYIWEYYKLHIISVLVIVLVGAYAIDRRIINPPDKTAVEMAVTTATSITDIEGFKSSIEEKLNIEEGYEFTLSDIPIGVAQDNQSQYLYSLQQKLTVKFAAHDIDLIISDISFAQDRSVHSFYLDLSQHLADPKYDSIRDQFVYGLIPIEMADSNTLTEDEKVVYNNGTSDIICCERPIGVKLTDNAILKAYGFIELNSTAISFASNSKRPELSLQLFDYIMGIE